MSLARDLRYAVRMLVKTPGFSAMAVVLLAVGMAATPAVFSFANALFWKPLDAPHSERLVRLYTEHRGALGGAFSYPAFRELRDHATSFEEMAAEYPTAPLNVGAGNDSRELNGSVVTANYFSLVGVKPLLGRFFLPQEDAVPDRDAVVVLSANLWRNRFAAEPSILDREILINGVPFRVIGIAPENFFGDEAGPMTDLWIPTAMLRAGYRWCDSYGDMKCSTLHILGRLAGGRTAAAAQAELNSIATSEHLPPTAEDSRIAVRPAAGVRPEFQAELAPQVRLMMALALTLLVIACANVAGLLVARGVARRREIAVRLALGARPRSIVGQLLTENLLLAVLGSGLGVVLGLWIRDSFVSLYTLQTEGGSGFYDVRVDWRMLLFSAAAALLTGLLFGLLPALRAVRCDMIADLKSSGGATGSPRGGRLRDFLAAGQVGLSLLLLVAAGLMVRSAQQILGGANFDPHHAVVMRLRPRLVKYSPAQAEAFYRAVEQRLASVSGVQSVGYGTGGEGLLWRPSTGESMQFADAGQSGSVRVLPVNDGFFSALGIPLLQGRAISAHDVAGSPPVLVANQAAAARFWPRKSPIGETLVLNGRPYRVVGVVADIGLRNLREASAPQFYSSFWQSGPGAQGDLRLALRVQGDPASALATLRRAIAAVDPNVPIAEDMPLIDQVKSGYATVWLARSVTLWCGIVALLLSAAGLYSVLAFAVRSRTREIGVRIALGAQPGDVISLVVRRGLLLCAVGAAAGLVLSLSTWRLLSSLLYGMQRFDVTAFVAAPAALAVVTLAASYLPARRAARVNPIAALRCD